MELNLSLSAKLFCSNTAAALAVVNHKSVQLARIVVAIETGLATVVVERLDDIKENLAISVANLMPTDCRKLIWLSSGDSTEQALKTALAGKNVELIQLDPKICQLKGLAACWLAGVESLSSSEPPLWHPSPQPCAQLVTHSPSWRLINERLARRMRRRESAEAGGDQPGIKSVLVAEMGAHEVTIDWLDGIGEKDVATCRRLLSEPMLGYRNLLGLARLSAAAVPPRTEADRHHDRLDEFLASAAGGCLSRLDLTIGDLLPAESVYGLYDLNACVYTLGKLHDLLSLEELKPSRSDIDASLSYAFIKTFFDTLVHTASAYGVPRIIVRGEFFDSVACRDRLMEVWNFAGIPKDAMEMRFLRSDCSDMLAVVGGLLL